MFKRFVIPTLTLAISTSCEPNTADSIPGSSEPFSSNWANHIPYTSIATVFPNNEEELTAIYKAQNTHIKVIGTRHTSNDIADTDGLQISLARFRDMFLTDDDQHVIVGAGVTYSGLIKFLSENHLALENLP